MDSRAATSAGPGVGTIPTSTNSKAAILAADGASDDTTISSADSVAISGTQGRTTGAGSESKLAGIDRMLVIKQAPGESDSTRGSEGSLQPAEVSINPHARRAAQSAKDPIPADNHSVDLQTDERVPATYEARVRSSVPSPMGATSAEIEPGGSGADDAHRDPRRHASDAGGPTDAGQSTNPIGAASSESTVAPTVPVASAPQDQGVDRAELVRQVSRHIESMRLASGHGEMRLNLTPDHLGALKLTISTDQHGVAARIMVQTAQAHQAIDSAKDQLRTALENRGLNLTSLDVSLSQNGSDAGGAFARQQERARELAAVSWNPRRATAPTSAPELVPVALPTVSHATDARLDYRA